MCVGGSYIPVSVCVCVCVGDSYTPVIVCVWV